MEPASPVWEAGALPLDKLCQTVKLGFVPKEIKKAI